MQTLTDMRAMLAARGLTPKHRLGQNFLHDQNLIRKLVDAACVTASDVVLEVGPGTGALTEALLERGATVVVVELDPDMAALIRERLAVHLGGPLTLIEGDCLDGKHALNPAISAALAGRPFTLVANLPYNAATPLIMNLLVDHPECRGLYVTIQKEVAERLAAKPGTRQYGPLSIMAQTMADVEVIATLPPSCFWPAPDVTSAMVGVRRKRSAISHQPSAASGQRSEVSGQRSEFSGAREAIPLMPDEARSLSKFVTGLFTRRRKQLGTILGRDRADWPSGVTPDLRPEALTPEQMVALWRAAAD